MQIQDFAKEYEEKSDEELLRLTLDSDQLTDEANYALTGELRKRGLDAKQIRDFKEQEKSWKQEQEKDIGELWLRHPYGIGRMHFGKANYSFNPASGMEEFTTTIFIVLFMLPLIPTGTYRVKREKGVLLTPLRVIAKFPLDWKQVTKVWLITLLGLLFLILAAIFYQPHP